VALRRQRQMCIRDSAKAMEIDVMLNKTANSTRPKPNKFFFIVDNFNNRSCKLA
jgi:hypothetical protein